MRHARLFAMILGVGCCFGVYPEALFGPVRNSVVAEAEDLRHPELLVLVVLALAVLSFGL